MNWLNVALVTFSLHIAYSSGEKEQDKAFTGRACDSGDEVCDTAHTGAKCVTEKNKKQCKCMRKDNNDGTTKLGSWTRKPDAPKNPDAPLSQIGGCDYGPDDADCTKAYEDRCFLRSPYSHNPNPKDDCCGKCNDGDHSKTCTWSYNETWLIDGKLISMSSSFPIENDACSNACQILQQGNTRQHYCDFKFKVQGCEAAKRSVEDAIKQIDNNPDEFCNKSAGSEIECSWQHTTGKTKPTKCGDRYTDKINGTFRYKTGDADCSAACEALGHSTRTPSDFCEKSALASIVEKCERASESFKKSGTPPDWCAASFTTPIMFTEPVVTEAPAAISLADDICDKAYKKGCWEKGAFKSCCGKCNADEGTLTCQWDFTGSPEFDGDKCKSPGTKIGGEFEIDMDAPEQTKKACFAACQHLSHNLKSPSDLCAASRKVAGCDNAKASIAGQLKNKGLCTQIEDMVELNAISLEADDVCQAAYEHRCFDAKWGNKSRFTECCAQCSAGSYGSTCHWNYAEPTDALHVHDKFSLGDSSKCNDVCKLMSDSSLTRDDYCEKGKIYEAAKNCPSALKSIQRTVKSTFCQRNQTTNVKCDWHYSYDTKADAFWASEGTLSGSFLYRPTDTKCETSCAALSYFNNLPQQYCINASVIKKNDPSDSVLHLWNQIHGGCPAAEKSLRQAVKVKPDLQEAWCDLQRIDVFDRAPNYAEKHSNVAVMDEETQFLCTSTFYQSCYNPNAGQKGPGRVAFSQCCTSCFQHTATIRCDWSATFGNTPIQGHFDYDPTADRASGYGCASMCADLRDAETIQAASQLCAHTTDSQVSKYEGKGHGKCDSGFASVQRRMSTQPACQNGALMQQVVLN